MTRTAKTTSLAPLKKLLVPTLAAFCCFVFVVVRPISDLSGQYAFLTYTLQILFFFPSGRIGTQIEATLLGIAGATLSLGYCCAVLAICAALNRRTDASPPDTDAARAVAGIFLGLLAFIGGLLRSRVPRLTNFTRIALFHAIFTLTSNQSLTHLKSGTFLHLFLPTVFASALALIPGLLILPMSSANHFSHLLLSSVHQTALTLPVNLKAALSVTPNGATPPKHSKALREFPQLLDQVYQELSFELSYSKLHPRTVQSVLTALRRVQKNPLLGGIDVGGHLPGPRVGEAMRRERERRLSSTSKASKRNQSVERSHDREALTGAFIDSSFALSEEVVACLDVSREMLVVAYDWVDVVVQTPEALPSSGLRGWIVEKMRSLTQAPVHPVTGRRMSSVTSRTSETPPDLQDRVDDARKRLKGAMRGLEMRLKELVEGRNLSEESTAETSGKGSKVQWASEDALKRRRANVLLAGRDRFRLAFHLTALLDVSKDVLHLLDVVAELYRQSHEAGNRGRWYFPHLGWSWLQKRGDEYDVEDDKERALQQGDSESRTEHAQDEAARVGLHEMADDPDYVSSIRLRRRSRSAASTQRETVGTADEKKSFPTTPDPPPTVKHRLAIAWMSLWDADKTLEARIVLSRLLRRLKHSHHVHFALKLSVGVALLALPSWMPDGNKGREWFVNSRGAWSVISYMYVLEVTTGATLRVGLFRIMGTLSGAVAGFVCTRIVHTNPYGLVALATACTVPISYLVLFTNKQGVGVVAGITLPPLLFINYLNLSDGLSDFDLAWNRAVDIMIGIVAAVLVNLVVFPVHARVRYLNIVSETLDQLTELYLRMSRDFLRPSLVYTSSNERYDPIEAKILMSIANSRSLVQVQKLEASLLPKPIKLYGEVTDILERLFELLSDLRVLRLGVPRKETVLDVLPLRRDLISSVLISLFACSHAFRSRSPLPQFLPAPRLALANVSAALNEHFEDIQAMAQIRHRTTDSSQASLNNELAILYGFAENEALAEVCEALDELLTASKTLFGVQNFLGPHALDGDTDRMSFGDVSRA